MSMGGLRGLPGAVASVISTLATVASNVASLVTDMATALAKLPTSGRAVSDAVWDAALKATLQNRARVKVQTNYVAATSLTTGTGEDLRFTDVTITAVSDWQNRCVVQFDGGASAGSSSIEAFSRDGISAGVDAMVCTARLTSSTNLRISCPQDLPTADRIYGRWTVIDYAATS